jgi:uncharacterized alkaline shock family protein YloU
MRMSIFDKLLLMLVLIMFLALSFFLGAVALSLISLGAVSEFLTALLPVWSINSIIIGVIALVVFLMSVRLLVASYGTDRKQSYTRLSITDSGEIAISIPTIKQIVSSYLSTKQDITATSSVVIPARDGLIVRIRICVKEGSILPEITTSVQKELKAHLETITGLVIKEIGVLVDNNKGSYTGKVR